MKKITLYSTSICSHCKALKAYLQEKGVEYTNYDALEDEAKAQEMIDLTHQTAVPVMVVTDDQEKSDPQILIGFNDSMIPEYELALGL